MLFGKFRGWSVLAPETREARGEGQPALDHQNFNHVHPPFSYHSQWAKQYQLKCALYGWEANQGVRFDLFVLVSWQPYS